MRNVDELFRNNDRHPPEYWDALHEIAVRVSKGESRPSYAKMAKFFDVPEATITRHYKKVANALQD